MSSTIADGVLAATHKLVQQAMSGQWQEVPKTIAERRVLLDSISAGASPQDQQWLGALRQAMAESDAAVERMTTAGPAPTASAPFGAQVRHNDLQPSLSSSGQWPPSGQAATANPAGEAAAAVDSIMEMIIKGR